MAAVIRRSPYELKKVYRKRKYSATKAADNVASEIIGVCLYDSMRKFGRKKVAEFDSTATEPEKTAEKIIDTFRRRRELSVGKVDWLSLIVANSDMKEFFEYRKVRC
jgi:adenylate kinase